MRRYQIAILSFALGIFFVASLAVFLDRKIHYDRDVRIETVEDFRTISVFFSNKEFDPQMLDCEKVYPVERVLGRITDNKKGTLGEFAYLALADLLKGPTNYEKSHGFFTSINKNTRIKRIIIENGIVAVDFNDVLDDGVAGSCRVQAIRSQITETLKQFPEINEIVISVNGNSEEILQP